MALPSFLLSAAVLSADQEITAVELARHLGTSVWRTPKVMLPDS